MKEKLDKRNTKVDEAIKRVDSVEAILKKVMIENVSTKAKNASLETIQASQAMEIRRLKVIYNSMEKEIREADEGKAKAITSKTIKDFQASTKFLAKKIVTSNKQLRISGIEFEDEKTNFMVAAFKEAIKITKDKVMAY